MASTRTPDSRSVDRVRALCEGNNDERTLRTALVEELRRQVGFDVYVWLLTDPETEVGSAPLANAPSPADLPRLIRTKYLTSTNRWTALDKNPVATLPDATGADLERSRVWREVLASYGVGDVASVVFRDPHGCWGWLDLWRSRDAASFSDRERIYLTDITVAVTQALRRCQARTFDHVPPAAAERSGPVVLILSPLLDVKAQTPETEAYLRALVPPDDDRQPIPAGAYNVAAQLLAVEEGVDHHQPSTRVHLAGGVWMTLRAARVDATDSPDQAIAVTIEHASPAERRAIFTRSHGLSPRETALVDCLAQGADTRTIANELFLSGHTVQDHLKSIFAKTGAHNRRTLLIRIAGG